MLSGITNRWSVRFGINVLSAVGLLAGAATLGPAAAAAAETERPHIINLGDYAKGDGSDETDAIQKAFDALPPTNYKEHVTADHPGGVLIIPRPKKFYGISKTIKVVEKWNTAIKCENPTWGTRSIPGNAYFRWIGPDDGLMFLFRSCKGMRVENLSLSGMDGKSMADWVRRRGKPATRLTRGVTGIVIGPRKAKAGFQTTMIFDHLVVRNVSTGIYLAKYPNNGPDVRELSFRMAQVRGFSDCGIVAASGNLANVTFETLTTSGTAGARHAILVNGGEMLVLNWNGGSARNPAAGNSEVRINAGGIQIVKAWSEWWGPFLTTGSRGPETGVVTSGSVNYPIILEGVRHYDGGFMTRTYRGEKKDRRNPVPLSIIYDQAVPLHLIGCSLWGGVRLDAGSQATIIDQATVFIDKNAVGFVGEGVSRFGRVVHVGTRDPANKRIVRPYVVDRRSTPGTAAPAKGVWSKGDRILNVDPNPDVPAKAVAGWICIESGEPGRWLPFGRLITPGR